MCYFNGAKYWFNMNTTIKMYDMQVLFSSFQFFHVEYRSIKLNFIRKVVNVMQLVNIINSIKKEDPDGQ